MTTEMKICIIQEIKNFTIDGNETESKALETSSQINVIVLSVFFHRPVS